MINTHKEYENNVGKDLLSNIEDFMGEIGSEKNIISDGSYVYKIKNINCYVHVGMGSSGAYYFSCSDSYSDVSFNKESSSFSLPRVIKNNCIFCCDYNYDAIMLSLISIGVSKNTCSVYICTLTNGEATNVMIGGNLMYSSVFSGMPFDSIAYCCNESEVRIDVDDNINNSRNVFWSSSIAIPMYRGGDYVRPRLKLGTPFNCVIKRGDMNSNTITLYNTDGSPFEYDDSSVKYSYDKLLTPNYVDINSHNMLNRGKSVNTLNSISLVMPMFYTVLRDPQCLNEFSYIGSTNKINYINMYNISSGKELRSDYPVDGSKYYCYNIGKRRNRTFSNVIDYLKYERYNNKKMDFSPYIGISYRNDGFNFITPRSSAKPMVNQGCLVDSILYLNYEHDAEAQNMRFNFYTRLAGYPGLAFKQEDD